MVAVDGQRIAGASARRGSRVDVVVALKTVPW